MAIKAGQILHDVNGFVIDRIQSAGPGNLNIPQEKIYELGNYNTVATIYDIPDLSFDLESFDMSTEFECVLVGEDPTTFSSTPGANEIDFADAIPIDVISPFKSRKGQYDIVKGIAVPYLTLERLTYRFGLRQNAAQTFTLRGDSIYYIPGQPYYEEFTHTGAGPYSLAHTALVYTDGSDTVHALCVTLVDSTTKAFKRCFFDGTASATEGFYYDDTSGAVTLVAEAASTSDYDTVRITYGSATLGSYTQAGNNPSGHKIHQGVSVKPAAVRPKDIDIYVSDGAATPTWTRLTGVQSVEVTRSVNLENDEEFGNSHYVSSEYDTADVSGSIGFKPTDPADLMQKLYRITKGGDDGEIIGPNLTTPIGVEIRVKHPDTGDTLKTLYIEDARFTVPGMQGRVQQKLETTLSFNSDGGNLLVYNGDRT